MDHLGHEVNWWQERIKAAPKARPEDSSIYTVYIYIYIERERERDRETENYIPCTLEAKQHQQH